MPGHTINQNTAVYKVYGTDEPYSGLTVEIGGYLYSTKGGAYEGSSKQLVAVGVIENEPQLNINNTQNPNNPVVRTETNRTDASGNRQYVRLDGSRASNDIHVHADGTIMEGHDPNNMGEIVTRTNPDAPAPVGTGMGGGNGTTPIPRSGGGGASGGGMGGGSY